MTGFVSRSLFLRSLGLLLGAGLAFAAAPAAAAAPAGHEAAVIAPVPRDVDDFSFSSFEAEYYLDRDADGHSTLRTTERLVAEFPATDQNRGIVRAIPSSYDGHPTDLTIESVTDADGEPREYETESDDGFELVTIAADDFVHGSQVYVITYLQTNVTRYFADTDSDEFMWDVNGTAWAQPFDQVTARVSLAPGLEQSLTGGLDCSWGPEGSRDSCTIEATETDGKTVVLADQSGLAAGENMTIAVGFEPGTFTPRDSSMWASPFGIVLVVGLLLVALSLAVTLALRLTVARDARGRPTIITEYLPPVEPELPVLAVIAGRASKAVAATLVSFAVRGIATIVDDDGSYALVYRGTGKPVRSKAAEGLSPIEKLIAASFFGKVLTPGERAEIRGDDDEVSTSIQKAVATAKTAAQDSGYRKAVPAGAVAVAFSIAALATGVTFVAAVALLADSRAPVLSGIALVLAVLPLVAAFLIVRHPLTASGAEARDHLRGMKRYLELAEEERLRVLQSVEGAERSAIGPDQVVRLYERLLPYAVLLGVEKSWSAVLGDAYDRTGASPEWYAGNSGFSAAAFASGVGSFSATASTNFTGSNTSSSSGGSTGGSFSGGGGGGGGGGGV